MPRQINVWNSLPHIVVKADFINVLKTKWDNHERSLHCRNANVSEMVQDGDIVTMYCWITDEFEWWDAYMSACIVVENMTDSATNHTVQVRSMIFSCLMLAWPMASTIVQGIVISWLIATNSVEKYITF